MAGLTGMKAICKYVNRSEPSVLMMVRKYDFPAGKIEGIWESDTEIIDAWRRDQVAMRVGERGNQPQKEVR